MGIFNFFKKKQEAVSEKAKEHIAQSERETPVSIEQVEEGNHGDHWAGMYGFDQFYQDQNIGNEMLAYVLSFGNTTKIGGEFTKKDVDKGEFIFSALLQGKEMLTSYPIIKSENTIPVKTQVIKEWKHVNGIEAQVEARGKNTFGLSFFATDYVEKRSVYTTRHNLEIELSGIAFTVSSPPEMENMSPDFVGYMPSAEFGKYSVMDYVGKILALKTVRDKELNIHGYMAKLRLIAMDDEVDFFVLDTFMSHNNIDLAKIKVGDRISGMLWLQGRIK